MKKVLYSTTALAAAGLLALSPADAQAAEKIKLGLGGYFIWAGGASESDAKSQDNHGGTNMWAESEVYVRGNTTLDNGIRVDAIIQFETDHVNAGGGNGTAIDESYLKVGNLKQWGEFRLGTTKMAAFITGRTTAPSVNTISNATNFGQSFLFVPSTTPLKGPGTFFSHEGAADRMLAMYVTPNLNGFQGAVSFTPAHANSDSPPMTKGMMATDVSSVSAGAGYKGKFGDAGVGLTAGYTKVDGGKAATDITLTAPSGGGAVTASTTTKISEVEYTTVQVGGSVSFAGFSVGFQWAERSDDVAGSMAADVEGWQAGIGYKTGPWDVALTWLNTEDDTNKDKPGKVEHNQYSLGVAYSLGAGVSVGASVFSIDLQDEMTAPIPDDPDTGGTDESRPAMQGNNNEGWGMLGGIRVNF